MARDEQPNRNATEASSEEVTRLGVPPSVRVVLYVVIPLCVVAVGLLLPVAARWALEQWGALPLRPAWRFMGGINSPWEIIINLAIWTAIAVGVAVTATAEALKVAVSDEKLEIKKGDRTISIPRREVGAVFMDGKHLVVLDHESRQRVRDAHDASPKTIAAAFRKHGYPWTDGDPYGHLFQPWTADTPELPALANTVLSARETALKKKARKESVELREAVERVGFAVRDEGARQYWRPLVRS